MSWNVPSYRIRAYLRRMKSNQARNPERESRLHIKRATAQIAVIEGIAITQEVIQATVLLNDLSLRGVFMFTAHQLPLGQHVRVTIDKPRNFFVRGRVVMCKMLSLHSGVLGKGYPYRVGILFEFRSIEERIAVKKYCDEISSKYLATAASC